MNNLSWFIYLADLLPALSGLLHGLAISLFVVCAAITVWALIKVGDLSDLINPKYHNVPQDDVKIKLENERTSVIKKSKILVASLFITALIGLGISTVLPSRSTIILIGASEFGERLVTNPSVNGIVDPSIELLKTWIEQQTKQIRDSK